MATTIIGPSFVVDGEIQGEERVVVHGTVKGRISIKGGLVLERSGVLEADVEAESAHISGQVTGNVMALSRIEITQEGRLTGDIRAKRILIADGAQFKGNVDMDA